MDLRRDSNETALFIERSYRDASAITPIMALLDIDEYLSIFVFTWGTNVTSPRLPWIPASLNDPTITQITMAALFKGKQTGVGGGGLKRGRSTAREESGGGGGGGVNTQMVISEVALALFTHPQPASSLLLPSSSLSRPLFLSCCSVTMATEKCGNTSVLQREGARGNARLGRKARGGGGETVEGTVSERDANRRGQRNETCQQAEEEQTKLRVSSLARTQKESWKR